jgi:antiviral defense system Shedu protein SduA
MAEDSLRPPSSKKLGNVLLQQGQPLQFADVIDAPAPAVALSSIGEAICNTFRAYSKAARNLLEGKYADRKDLAPPHMRGSCNIFIVHCNDGIFVRYDLVSQQEMAKVRYTGSDKSLAEMSPMFSEQLIHFPQDPRTYVPSPGGVEFVLAVTDPKTGATTAHLKARPLIYATTALPKDFETPPPPTRPVCLASIYNEMDFQLGGFLVPTEAPAGIPGPEIEQFITYSRIKLPVGWQTIEIYPPLGEEYWKAEYAPIWAELDLLAAIAQQNLIASTLRGIDSRGATRKRYAALLNEFETLLTGPEEPVHQFLKCHPDLLCPTHDRYWSKLHFGDRVSDFVFREPHNDYLLVEIEAPIRELFRKDGQQREELTHAINQITDWIQYITDNKQKVEEELGLTGISTNPRILVVIGRSAALTEDNRRKLAMLQAQQNKLRILTYDDLVASARSNLERILGPLALQGQNVEIYYYYYKEAPPPPK